MRILLVGIGWFHGGQSHYARLRQTMPYLATRNDVVLVQLVPAAGLQPVPAVDPSGVRFHAIQVEFSGWTVLDAPRVARQIAGLSRRYDADLVVLQSEVWDLVRVLSKELRGTVPFATVFHAVPFLTAPMRSSGRFTDDVAARLRTEPADDRRAYIRAHHHEFGEVMSRIAVIAANRTVAHYFQQYLDGVRFETFDPPLSLPQPGAARRRAATTDWDFLCMARFEHGKGLEFLRPVLDQLSRELGRTVSCALVGNVEDDHSMTELSRLREAAGSRWTCDYLGFADETTKPELLSRAGAFLYPSYSDTLAIVVLEALAAGLPVVAWRAPYTELFYRGTEAVKLVAFPDTEAFAAAAAEVVGAGGQLAGAATSFAAPFHGAGPVAVSEEAVYRRIHERARRRRERPV